MGFDIPFAIVRSGTTLAQGQVVALAGTTFSVRVTAGNLSQARAGDSFRLPGTPMVIQSINTQSTPNTVTVQQLAAIPFELRDDDTATMPHFPDVTQMQASFAVAYVAPVFDLGGTSTVTFLLNVATGQSAAAQDWNSREQNTNDYWVAYLLGAFQGDRLRDADPNSERPAATFGVTSPLGGSLVYFERHRESDVTNPTDEERDTVVHEVAHVFDNVDVVGSRPTDGRGNLHPETINRIRMAPRPIP
jgi:hypothetical protein